MKCFTTEGSTQSLTVAYTLAGVPATPLSAPVSDLTITSSTRIKVDVATISDNGGSTLLSYSIEMDDGQGGDFITLYGDTVNSLSTTFTVFKGIKVGRLYRFRYRS